VQTLLFTSLPEPQSRWKSFLLGWNVQVLLLACLLLVRAPFHQKLFDSQHYHITDLVLHESAVAPQHVTSKLINHPKPPLRALKPTAPEVASLMASPQIKGISGRTPRQPEPVAPEVKFESKMPVLPNSENPKIIAVNTFSPRSSVLPKVVETPTAIRTGGFGTVNGTFEPQNRGVANITQQGSFDSPLGPGNGSGQSGSKPGTVVSAGFGAELATVGEKSLSQVQQSGFDVHHAEAKSDPAPAGAPTSPVEIIFKPKPDYTDQARQLKISGEVRLQVLFTASGQVHVIRVLQGLGYGLDEQAVKAAEQIKFKPALHIGQPVDSSAVVHIVFDLVS